MNIIPGSFILALQKPVRGESIPCINNVDIFLQRKTIEMLSQNWGLNPFQSNQSLHLYTFSKFNARSAFIP